MPTPPYCNELERLAKGGWGAESRRASLWVRLNSGLWALFIWFPTGEQVYCFKRGAGEWWWWCV